MNSAHPFQGITRNFYQQYSTVTYNLNSSTLKSHSHIMDAPTTKGSHGNWASDIHVLEAQDKREQPWKAAVNVEVKDSASGADIMDANGPRAMSTAG
jgi:hypothetical protein